MNLTTTTRLKQQSGYEKITGLIEGDMIEISKTVKGVKTKILEYEPPEGITAEIELSFHVIEI